ncbi:hypothetical protein N8I77_009443 [Diaporthe amygdali]|uniref:MARVEL domain-containing protein n=1 Tax=Phomopsis amygdali TaxID=1214568 RepID=A0AAD9S9T1_PHOAM|nr:hypothetical protein N8I77_009443 [Diaporthe amygdali]
MTASNLVPISQRWYNAKLILRVLIVCLCGANMGLSVLTSFGSLIMGPVMIADIVWTLAELITLAIRRAKRRGIHPIAHLVFDVLFVLAYLFSTIAWAFGLAHASSHNERVVYFRRRNQVAEAFVMLFVLALLIFHSILFVRSCIEVHQRRLARRASKDTNHTLRKDAGFEADRESQAANTD